MRVLITGAGGWIGSHAVRAAVKRGWATYAMVRTKEQANQFEDLRESVNIILCDLDDWSGVAEALVSVEVDACLHCAWFAEPGKYLDGLENIASLMNSLKLVEILGSGGCGVLVGVGSCFEYQASVGYFSEDALVESDSLYAGAKNAVATVLEPLGKAVGIRTAWARLFLQYGPREDPDDWCRA